MYPPLVVCVPFAASSPQRVSLVKRTGESYAPTTSAGFEPVDDHLEDENFAKFANKAEKYLQAAVSPGGTFTPCLRIFFFSFFHLIFRSDDKLVR